MNMEEAIKIIDDNAASENDSFLDFMHERSTFDEYAFWKFYNAVRLLGYELRHEESLSREWTYKIMKSYEWYLLLIGFHFDENDGISVDKLPGNYSQYSVRLRTVVDAFLEGKPITEETESWLNEALENKVKNDCPTIPKLH